MLRKTGKNYFANPYAEKSKNSTKNNNGLAKGLHLITNFLSTIIQFASIGKAVDQNYSKDRFFIIIITYLRLNIFRTSWQDRFSQCLGGLL